MSRLSISFGELLNTSDSNETSVFQFQSQSSFGDIQFVDNGIVRCRFSSVYIEDETDYALIDDAFRLIDFKKNESAEHIDLIISTLKVRVFREDGRLSFFDSNDQPILEDGLATQFQGEVITVFKSLRPNEKFIGLGEKVGSLNRRGTAYVNWNTDKFAYDTEQDQLYSSIPFYIGINDGLYYGIFLNNTHRSTFNFGASTERFSWFSVEGGVMDYFFITADSISGIIEKYTALTGRIPLPPKWSLGFQQCRYSYYPQSEVETLARTFRDKSIPCDVLYLDIHYMDKYKAFTFDADRFPEPKALVKDLNDQGFQLAVILDPGIKVEKGYEPYDSGIKNDVFIKYPDGPRYIGEVWPGESHFPDFTSDRVRNWWSNLLAFYTDLGITGFWNDMNEPAAWGQCLPDILPFDFEGRPTSHRQARNVYGMQMTRATRRGTEQQMDQRPFLLTRAGFSGMQRYGAKWTGDNISSDDHMMLGIRLINSLALSGVPFSGNDVGGFAEEATPELYARWISIGAFQPFFRAHSMVNTRDAEPWSFGEVVEQIARNYIGLRYQLMPYIYSLFYHSSRTGYPITFPMVLNYPDNDWVYDPTFEHQFFLGDGILIAPLKSTETFVKVQFPEGDWYDLYDGTRYSEGGYIIEAPIWRLPVFVRSGAILPSREICQHLRDETDILQIHLYAGKGEFMYYEDDGISKDDTKYNIWEMTLDTSSFTIQYVHSSYKSPKDKITLYLHGIQSSKYKVNERLVDHQYETFRWLEPVKSIDTFSTDKGVDMCEEVVVLTFEMENNIKVVWE